MTKVTSLNHETVHLPHIHTAMTPGVASQAIVSQPSPQACGVPHPIDEPAVVAALVIRISRRLGRSSNVLPKLVHQALLDLVWQGDATAQLLFAWIEEPRVTDQEILNAARLPDTWRSRPGPSRPSPHARIYRHNRFFRAGSARLAELDRARILQLRDLLIEEMRHDA
jgi:hypothetical protein